MRRYLTTIFCFLWAYSTYAQQNVSGTVSDTATGDPLPGVSVLIKGTTQGTETDFDGNYTLSNVPKGAILSFTFIGFETQEIPVKSTKINVSLTESAEQLEEVVVVGYGTQKKKEVTGAVTVVDSKAIEKINPTRVEQALQGQVTGVNITSGSGSPGSGLNIRIRGVSTNGDARPLILVDGNVIEDLSVLNPNDIKSINVLKDATAGIYGVRAANGVILITTKTGRKNTPLQFTLDAYTGIQSTSKKIDLLSVREYAKYVNDAAGTGNTQFFVYPSAGTDWQEEVFQNAIISDLNFSANGGTEKSTYSFGIGYLDQDGIIGQGKNNYNRLTARINYQQDILENLKLSATGIYTHSEKENLPEGGIGSVLYSAVNVNPNLPVYDTDGNFSLVEDVSAIEIINPLAQIANTYNTTRVDKYAATLGLDYTFLENFTVSSKFQINHAVQLDDVFRPLVNYGPGKSANVTEGVDVNGNITGGNEVIDHGAVFDDFTWDNYLTYKKTFAEDHDVTILLGTSIFKTKGEFYGQNGFRLANGSNSVEDASINNILTDPISRFRESQIALGENVYDVRLSSIFTRLQYSYKGKYLFSGVLRRDGSSRFNPDGGKRFGYFPSVSIGWNASDEAFLENVKWLNSLKLRASYGVIGNDRINQNFAYLNILDGEAIYAVGNSIVTGVATGRIANEDFTWEEQKTGNIGFDARVFNHFNLSFDAFSRKTENLLITAQSSGLLGASAPGAGVPVINAGTVENKGIEFKIGYNNNFSDDFSMNTSFNISYIHNEVTEVGNLGGFEQDGAFGIGLGIIPSRMEAGFPLGYFYGFKTDGLHQTQVEIDALNAASPTGVYHEGAQPGDLKFVDVDGNGYIDENDKTYIGDPIPEYTFGFNIGFNYKNIDFSANATGTIGNDMVRDYERRNLYANIGDYMLGRWQGSGTSNSIPRATSGASINTDNFSDFYVEDASYLRLQNIQIGYNFSDKILQNTSLSKLRIYLSGNNLFTFTNYKGYDPSASSGSPIGSGIDKGFYPVATSYLLGINVKLK